MANSWSSRSLFCAYLQELAYYSVDGLQWYGLPEGKGTGTGSGAGSGAAALPPWRGTVLAEVDVSGSMSAGTLCAPLCYAHASCQGIAFSEVSCLLLSGEAPLFCDPRVSSCDVESPADNSLSPLTIAGNQIFVVPLQGVSLEHTYKELYWWDKNGMYCLANSQECAGAREYFDCLQNKSCTTHSDYADHREQCRTMSCSPAQCGFSEDDCDSMVADCASIFIGCMLNANDKTWNTFTKAPCQCTKNYMSCIDRAKCLDNPVGQLLGTSMEELALVDGCSAGDLGNCFRRFTVFLFQMFCMCVFV